ncbi:hypothetical protein FH972_024587 [Carpinus fangiana]|uniref:Aminoglycoside phosphotransferase domain-containing protein n=1 Tax=Carpinus fangiana TaxID=176857 RepID=A0A5N6KZ54_9ROSI|nr:hypothetical protein FH972_024587 [Carpinus fangiana]
MTLLRLPVARARKRLIGCSRRSPESLFDCAAKGVKELAAWQTMPPLFLAAFKTSALPLLQRLEKGKACSQQLQDMRHARSYPVATQVCALDDDEWEKSIDDEVAALLALVNTHQLEARASSLNGGKSCSFRPGHHTGPDAIMGCANYHAWLDFANGETWLARIPRKQFSDVPDALVEYLVQSEYATLRFLEGTSVPAPRAYGFGLESEASDAVGVSYLLLEVLPGKPWQSHDCTVEQKQRVYEQYAGILAEIKRHSLPRIGSLVVIGDDEVDVGPVASNRFINLGRYGPFDDAASYFESIARQHLELIADGQLYPQHRAAAFVYYTALQQDIQTILKDSDVEDVLPGFYLKHVDDKGDHLLVDDEGNIKGIIDWQYARCVPACEAFGPSMLTVDLGALYGDGWGITDDDRRLASVLRSADEAILARYAEHSDRVKRFHWGLGSGLNEDEIIGLLKNILVDMDAAHRGNFEQAVAQLAKQLNLESDWPEMKTLMEKCFTDRSTGAK